MLAFASRLRSSRAIYGQAPREGSVDTPVRLLPIAAQPPFQVDAGITAYNPKANRPSSSLNPSPSPAPKGRNNKAQGASPG
ncbi:MAG: hypothetical protein OJI67_15710 [Prosthecobacter sp.]|nr:hypothetical protein [Prosthecobacter sp.]